MRIFKFFGVNFTVPQKEIFLNAVFYEKAQVN